MQHVTAPVEYQKTEPTIVYSKLKNGLSFSAEIDGNAADVVLTSDSNDNLVAGYEHSHVFPNLPLTLLASNQAVRSAASELNNGSVRSDADPQHNEGKG